MLTDASWISGHRFVFGKVGSSEKLMILMLCVGVWECVWKNNFFVAVIADLDNNVMLPSSVQ